MTLNQLQYFCELAKNEHYGKTAKLLFISQPSLSKAISNLEEELGVQLFVPKGRRVELTQAGKLFYYQVVPILEQLDHACKSMEQFRNIEEQYNIGSISTATTSVVAPLLDAYKQDGYTIPKLNFFVSHSTEILDHLVKGKIDIAFCTKADNLGEVHYILVAKLPYVVVMRNDDPLAKKEYLVPEDLNGREMVFSNSSIYASKIQKMLLHFKCQPIIRGVANDDSALIGMLSAGIGIFITNDYPQIHVGNLIVKELKQEYEYREIHLAYTDHSLSKHAIKEFIQYIEKYHQIKEN